LQMKKSRGASHIQSCAKQIIKAALPIQCVEAVFLGAFMTSTFKDVDRVPLSFKSKFRDNVHRHIVLAIRFEGQWGALGLSRRKNLMNKPFKFASLEDLIKDYEASYKECFHRLLTVYAGLPLPHELFTDQPVKWRALKVRLYSTDPIDVSEKLENFTSNMQKMADHYRREGVLPDVTVKKKKDGFLSTLKKASSGIRRAGTTSSTDNSDNESDRAHSMTGFEI